ncbi:MAG: TolB family protein [Fimbriimonadaceae bacterium]
MLTALLATSLLNQTQPLPMSKWPKSKAWASEPGELHISNIKQLTFSGQNAEAYFNLKGDKLTYQTRQPNFPDEQIFTMGIDGSNRKLISTGKGRCTCSYFTPDGKYIYFSSTHIKQPGAQPAVDMSKGYVWMVNPNMGIYRTDLNGKNIKPIITKPGYIAETTISPDGKYMVFTAGWNGDVDIYRSNLDGSNIKPLTTELGYDGGPFVSYDSKTIVYRRSAPFANNAEISEYKDLLKQNLVRPSKMDLWAMNADGSNKRQITNLNAASFAPFLHPNGKTIIFGSNHHDPKRREFDLFTINIDGTNLHQVTYSADFDGFPMFTRDGKKLVWGSNRHGLIPHDTNIFIADWN